MGKAKIAISAESTIDLPKELLEKWDIKVIPYTVLFGEETKIDGEITSDDIFNFVEETGVLPKTCAINEYSYDQFFEDLLKDYDAVIHFGLSTGISSSTNNAISVGKTHKNVYVVDTKSLSTGIALLAIRAREFANEGDAPEEVFKKISALVNKVQASFVINTLEYLYKGGRCSSLSRVASTVLRIKPSIIVEKGKLIPHKKFIGRGKFIVEDYCEYILEKFPNPDLSRAFVTFSSATPEMIESAKKALTDKGFKEILITSAGATITSHCGPKTLGILYINK